MDNGKIITTAGISSGIDGSIYAVSKMLGKARAQMVALNMEYNRLRLDLATGSRVQVLNTEGGTDHWEVQWQVQATSAPAEILREVGETLERGSKWSRRDSGASRDATRSLWRFTDETGREWNGQVSVRPDASVPNQLIVSIRVDRAGRG